MIKLAELELLFDNYMAASDYFYYKDPDHKGFYMEWWEFYDWLSYIKKSNFLMSEGFLNE